MTRGRLERKTLAGWVSADRLAALLFLALFGVWFFQGKDMRSALVVDVVGPGFFPMLVGAFGSLLALILIFRPSPAKHNEKLIEVSNAELVPILMLIAYVIAIDPLGFPVATMLFVTVGCRYFGCPTWRRATILGLAVTTFSFVLFRYGLEARLPFGILKWLGIGDA
jgi:hypothetical protein